MAPMSRIIGARSPRTRKLSSQVRRDGIVPIFVATISGAGLILDVRIRIPIIAVLQYIMSMNRDILHSVMAPMLVVDSTTFAISLRPNPIFDDASTVESGVWLSPPRNLDTSFHYNEGASEATPLHS